MPHNPDDCAQPCSCLITDDGFDADDEFSPSRTTEGRRNTVVSGQGTVSDPYTVSFIDSEFYRPNAGETSATPFTANNNVATSPDDSFVVYQTPGIVFINIPFPLITVAGLYFVVGAEVQFPANATGERKLTIQDFSGRVIAGENSNGFADSPHKMACVGFADGLFIQVAPFTSGKFERFQLTVIQSSGGTLLIDEIRFWVGTL